jgi:hypothetical protein
MAHFCECGNGPTIQSEVANILTGEVSQIPEGLCFKELVETNKHREKVT